MAESLEATHLTLAYQPNRPVVRDLNMLVDNGRITALVGPNGCGKSTLLRGLARILKPIGGNVTLGGRSLSAMNTLEIARIVGVLPQSPVAPDGITVEQLVLMGRYPHKKWWQAAGTDDIAIARRAMADAEVLKFADRLISTLSGGQKQRAWIAMALAQNASILLLDEPTTFLDMAHQLEVLDLLQRLNRDAGTTVVMVLHDLNQAARYADFMIMMRDGAVVGRGSPESIMNEAMMRRVFSVECRVFNDPVTTRPICVPLRASPTAS